MTTQLLRSVRIMVTLLSLTMLVGLAGPASAQESDAKASCKKGGWETLVRTEDGSSFRNQGDCVSYVAAHGGVPVVPAPEPVYKATLVVTMSSPAFPGGPCIVNYIVGNAPGPVPISIANTIVSRGQAFDGTYSDQTFPDGTRTITMPPMNSGQSLTRAELYRYEGDDPSGTLVGPIGVATGLPMTCGG